MRILLITLSLLVISSQQKVLAWGDEGHRIVCEIAYKLMTQEARTEVRRLLALIPDRDKREVLHRVKAGPDTPFLFNMSCTWADEVKYGWGYDEMSDWHYVNADRSATEIKESDCDDQCVTHGINHFATMLASEEASDLDKLNALMFLAHLVGDVHQPMHAGFKDDVGGNNTIVRNAPRHCRKMHRIWDTCMIRETGKDWEDIAEEILHGLTKSEVNSEGTLDPYSWATESLRIARNQSVQYCELERGECKRISSDRNKHSYALADGYQERHIGTVEDRLKLAGIRLAAAVNEAFN